MGGAGAFMHEARRKIGTVENAIVADDQTIIVTVRLDEPVEGDAARALIDSLPNGYVELRFDERQNGVIVAIDLPMRPGPLGIWLPGHAEDFARRVIGQAIEI